MRAIDAKGVWGAWSNQPSATVPADAPTLTPTSTRTPTLTPTPSPTPYAPSTVRLPAPTLSVSETATTTIEISWTEVTGADRYELWVWWDISVGWQPVDNSLRGTSYSDHGLTPGRTYYYAVSAIDMNGSGGAWSNYPSATVPVNPQTDPALEKAALVALYNATDGANWTTSANWATDEPLSNWHGVTTDSNGRVTELRLPSNELNGTIPDLSALTHLTALDLNTNPLSGQIPDLSALTNLTTLDLSLGLLNGPIPDLSALTSLTSLNLKSNDLTGEIPALDSLTGLTTLDLSHNKLEGPVPDLSALTNLASLDLSGNDLCLPVGTDLSAYVTVVADHLRSLNLSACTDA